MYSLKGSASSLNWETVEQRATKVFNRNAEVFYLSTFNK